MNSDPLNHSAVIHYKPGYKYQLQRVATFPTLPNMFPKVKHQWFRIYHSFIVVDAGYAWDGASGPAFDTKNFMRASLVHDVIYQVIREGFIDKSYRKDADKLMYKICREDGMSWFRAKYIYHFVRWFGGLGLTKKPIEIAP